MSEIREWLAGKKTYLVQVAAILTGVVGYLESSISLEGLLAILWVAFSTMFLRAGVAKLK